MEKFIIVYSSIYLLILCTLLGSTMYSNRKSNPHNGIDFVDKICILLISGFLPIFCYLL